MAAVAARTAPPVITGVMRGRELTRKQGRLRSFIGPIDLLLEGGLPRGRISEITGRKSSGKTTLALTFIATATRRGEIAAIIDWEGACDPESIAATGAALSRILWIHPQPAMGSGTPGHRASPILKNCLKVAEMVLEAGGFGLLVIDLGERSFALAPGAAFRIARVAERAGTAVIVLAGRPVCGTFAATNLALERRQALFSRGRYQTFPFVSHWVRDAVTAPIYGSAMFDGIRSEAVISRNKLGHAGTSAQWLALSDPAACVPPLQHPSPVSIGEQPAALR